MDICCTPVTDGPWTAATETSIFDSVIATTATDIPFARYAKPHHVETPEEISNLCEHWTWVAGHDTHIVQALSHAIALFKTDAGHRMIQRQTYDDGAHAGHLRSYILKRTGADPISQIGDIAAQHAEMLGDLPWRNIYSFFAWELHYELYILARLHIERRTARLYDPGIQGYAHATIGPDEEAHRLLIMDWFLDHLRSLDTAQREDAAQQVIAYDNEIQGRLASYLKFRYRQSKRSMDPAFNNASLVYDGFRRTILTRLFGPIGHLVSVGDLSC